MNNFREKDTIKLCIELLSQLTSPNRNSDSDKSLSLGVDDVIESNLIRVRNSWSYRNLRLEDGIEYSWIMVDSRSKHRWHFVYTCIQLLRTTCDVLQSTHDEKVKLLSVSQKKAIEGSFQFVVSLALLPNLLPGVGISPEAKCKHIGDLGVENLKDFAKYRRLCFVMDAILYLNENDVFHEIIASKYLEDVLAALIQLAFVPLKKPTVEDESFKGFDYVDDDFEIKHMSFAIWNKLSSNKNKYRNYLLSMQKQTYRPLVIKKYLLLLDTKKSPRWMKQNLSKLLTDVILEDGGVVALIRAIIEVDSDSPLQWSHCDVVARLISNTALNLDRERLKLFVPQMLKILSTARKQQYELVYIQVISLAVKLMINENPVSATEIILKEVLQPLEMIRSSNEDRISTSIEELYNLCVLPTNTSSAVPIDIVISAIFVLFKIYAKVKDSVSYLKTPVKELLAKFVLEAEPHNLSVAFDYVIFNEPRDPIVRFPDQVKFIFTANGGVSVLNEECDNGLMENGVVLLDLIKNLKNNDRPVNSLFVYLLRKFISLDGENNAEKRVIAMLLLTELSQNQTTLKQILKNSQNIIEFIKDLLVANSNSETNHDVVCVCLTFLTMVLYDLRKKKDVNWKPLDDLKTPLETLKKSTSGEVKVLAIEVYNLISTRSLLGKENGEEKKLIEEIPSACEEAFANACHDLLPVRAHGLMELIGLLCKGDVETMAKIDKILCLFQENMKDADSYLYLRAIEGLATIALLKPSKILPFLCEEFTICADTETRMKLGEILMRTVKLLRDFVPSYKHLLVNTFLNGAKSEDYLIRASSLSNLGELCFMLKFNIEDIVNEILYCTRNIALNDANPEARRASVFLISSLLRGLDTYMFKVLEPVLSDLYKTLKKIYSDDQDEPTRIHAKISLDVLNENTKSFFNPEPKFEKKIHVLRPF